MTFILDGREVREVEPDVWARWFEAHDAERKVGDVAIVEGVRVATHFVGLAMAPLDFRERPVQTPLVFETRVFGGELAGERALTSTWTQAEIVHAAMVQRVRATLH